MILKWQSSPDQPNEILDCGGFYVSYNPNTFLRGKLFAGDGEDGRETALISPDHRYYILNGDFREQYFALAPDGFDACFTFFKARNEHSSWTSDDPQPVLLERLLGL